jgi:hypothetical protein
VLHTSVVQAFESSHSVLAVQQFACLVYTQAKLAVSHVSVVQKTLSLQSPSALQQSLTAAFWQTPATQVSTVHTLLSSQAGSIGIIVHVMAAWWTCPVTRSGLSDLSPLEHAAGAATPNTTNTARKNRLIILPT